MHTRLLTCAALLLGYTFFTACSPSAPAETQLLPGNAQLVLSIDPGFATQKLSKAGMPLDSLLNKMFQRDSAKPGEKAFLQKIRTESGINWAAKWHWAVSQQTQDSIPLTQYNVVGSLKDAVQFERLLQSDSLLGKKIQAEKGFKYVYTDKYSILAWTDQYLLTTAWDYSVKPYYDTVQGRFIIPVKKDLRKQLLAYTGTLFTQKQSASMASQKGFAAMFKEPAEGYLYSNSSQYTQLLSSMPLPLPKLEELLADNYTTATLQFETGKILATVTTHTNPLLSSVFKKHAGPVVALDQIKLPKGYTIRGFYSASFDPQLLPSLLKELEVDQLAESFLEKQGLTTNALAQAFKGQLQVIMADSTGSNKTKIFFALPTADTAKTRALLLPLVEKGFLVNNNGKWQSGALLKSLSLHINQNKDVLVLGTDSSWNQQYLNGQCEAVLPADIQKAFTGKSTAGWINLNGRLINNTPDSSEWKGRDQIQSLFKDIRIYSENYADKKVTGHWEITLWDQQTTSLAKITSLLTDLALNKRQDWRTAALEEQSLPMLVPGVIRSN